MSLALIAFDFDGVILESVDAKTVAFGKMAAAFGSEVADRLMLYHRLHGGVSRFEKIRWLYQECLGRACTAEELAFHAQRFQEYAFEEVVQAPMVAGVMDVLDYWFRRVPLCVCSATPHEELLSIMKQRNLIQYFTGGIYGSPPNKQKTLHQATLDARIDPADAIMIGDSFVDLQAAEAVGTHFYGRGECFAATTYPWHEDLTVFTAWLTDNTAMFE